MSKSLFCVVALSMFSGSPAWAWECPISIAEMRTQTMNEASALYRELETIVSSPEAKLPNKSEFRKILVSLDHECMGDCIYDHYYRTVKFSEHSCQPYVQCRVYVEYDCVNRRPELRLEIDPE